MKRVVFFLAILALAACNSSLEIDTDNPPKSIQLTTKQEAYVATGNSFAFRFVEGIEKSADKDYIVSPLSMQFLLGMIMNGAKGKTADEICATLGYGASETSEVNDYCRSMLTQLPQLDKLTKLTLANAIFVDKGYSLLNTYVAAVHKYYDAEVANLDFGDSQASAARINKWCSDNTQGMVPKVLDQTSPDVLAYLLNALYFKGEWAKRFDEAASAKEKFTLPDGKSVEALMMKQYSTFEYTETELFQAVSLPYGNGAFEMTVLLPQGKNGPADVVQYFCKNAWQNFRLSMFDCSVDLWLPRFETKFGMQLNDLLSTLGMPTAFTPGADFSAMSPNASRLSFVRQDAAIKVDEKGSEAAAVSTGAMEKNRIPGSDAPPVVFHANRPFVYLITEMSTGAILFAGRYSGK